MQNLFWVTFFQFYVTNFNGGKVKGYIHSDGGWLKLPFSSLFRPGSALFRLSVLHPLGLLSLPTFGNSKRGYFRGFLGLGGASVPFRALVRSMGL